MAKGARVGCKRKARTKIRMNNEGSDESDEDYNVSEEEEVEDSEDEYCSSLVGDESEESFFNEEEEDLAEKKVKKTGKPKARKAQQVRKKNKNVRPRKRRVSRKEEEEEEDYDDDDDYEDDDFFSIRKLKKDKASRNKHEDDDDDYDDDDANFSYEEDDDFFPVKKLKKDKVSRNKDEDDDDKDFSYEEEDDFSPVKKPRKGKASRNRDEDDDDTDFSYEEDDESGHKIPKKKSGVSRRKSSRSTDNKNPRKKTKISSAEADEESDYDDGYDMEFIPDEKIFETVTRRRTRAKNRVVTRQNRSDTLKEIRDEKPTTVKRKKRTERGRSRRKKLSLDSDSDTASSRSSDYEYTISEEEREQIREATELCRGFPTGSRSSCPLRINNVETQRKQPAKKGKEKVSDTKAEPVKQVCGICLSEEGKRTIRGILNCCSHYFCFACIMEWSKVESRCPLCKQRFTVINRKVRADGGHDLRDAVFQVPERNQVYQPTEEELMGYLDPYESVMCTECHQGGDDALMLLCDLCDSPAHTYCVGLGHEVPDGNWYCDDCRPAANASSIPANETANDFSVGGSSPFRPTVRETFDLNEAYVPDTPLTTQIPRHPQSSRTSLASGFAAPTLFERRRIHRQIQRFRSVRGRRRESNESTAGPVSGMNIMPHGTDDHNSSSRMGSEVSSFRPSVLRGRELHVEEASASVDLSYFGLATRNEVLRMNETSGAGFGHHLLHPCVSRQSNGSGTSEVPREGTVSSRTLQGHQM